MSKTIVLSSLAKADLHLTYLKDQILSHCQTYLVSLLVLNFRLYLIKVNNNKTVYCFEAETDGIGFSAAGRCNNCAINDTSIKFGRNV